MSATRVVLDLATASPDTEFSTAVLTRAGEIVGVSASSIRVAAGRLCRENKTASYRSWNVRPSTRTASPPTAKWRGGELVPIAYAPWDGTWIAVEHSGLKRSDRTAARRHDQALRLAGFEEWKPTLAVRPNNLLGGTGSARRTLHRLGAASESARHGNRSPCPRG